MPLNKNQLQARLAEAFATNFVEAKDQEWGIPKASEEMARAIAEAVHDYVAEAEVNGLLTQVRDPGNNVIGTGTQTGPVKLS